MLPWKETKVEKEDRLTAPDGRVRKVKHSLIDHLVWQGRDERGADVPLVSPPATEDLGDAVLLAQEGLLVHLVEQAALACPRAEGLEVFQTLFLRPDVTNLDHDQRVLVRGAGGKKHVCVKLARCALDAITEVPQKRGRRRTVEAASHGVCRQKAGS